MRITGAQVYGTDYHFHDHTDIQITDGFFTGAAEEDDEVIDAAGLYAIPGLTDIHFHGCLGQDFCDGTQEAVRTLSSYEASEGITSICPAMLTLSIEDLKKALSNAAHFAAEQKERKAPILADLIGINMEGPFISKVKKGAQNEKYIIPADAQLVDEFVKASDGLLKIIGLAPEDNPGFEEYIAAVKDKVRVSLAHTNAPYEVAKAAFDAGACHAVHLYNAMPPFGHREPGVVGAVSDSPHVFAEIICDGNHVHPAMVRAAFKFCGPERMVLISDSLRATGMGDGLINLGGQDVIVKGTRATLVEGGNLAGSVTNQADCMRIAVKEMGIPLETAIRAATINPVRAIGQEKSYGSIEPGKHGNVVLLRKDLSLAAVIKDGMIIRDER